MHGVNILVLMLILNLKCFHIVSLTHKIKLEEIVNFLKVFFVEFVTQNVTNHLNWFNTTQPMLSIYLFCPCFFIFYYLLHLVSDGESVYNVIKVNVVFKRHPCIPKHCPPADVIQAFFIHIFFWTEFGGRPPYPGLKSGAPNNGSLLHVNKLKTLFDAIQSTFRSLEIHSKKRYHWTWILFGHPRGTWLFLK